MARLGGGGGDGGGIKGESHICRLSKALAQLEATSLKLWNTPGKQPAGTD